MLNSAISSRVRRRFAIISFVLLFPGFFLYHYSVARGYIIPFLGGYFSVIAIVSVLVFIFLGAWRDFFKVSPVSAFFFVSLFFVVLVSSCNYLFGVPSGYSSEMFRWSVIGVVLNFSLYFLGLYISADKVWLYFALTLMLFLLVISNIGDNGIFYVKMEADPEVSDSVATYQGFGRSILIVSIFALSATFGKSYFYYLSLFFSLTALFLNGARTEFALYVISLMFVNFIYVKSKPKIVLDFLFIILLFSLSLVLFLDYIPSSRMFQLLDLFSSSSFQARDKFFEFSVVEVFDSVDNFVLGSYGSYTSLGGIGAYPHNIFSAWLNLGIVGFFLYLCILVLLWFGLFSMYREFSDYSLYKLLVCFVVCVTTALIFSKDYSYILLGFAVGLHAQLRALKSNNCSRVRS